MPDSAEHGQQVLSAILPARRDLLDRALLRLTPDHFVDKNQRVLFTLLERFNERTGGVLPKKYLDDLLRNRPVGQAEVLSEMYQTCAETLVEDAEFEWSVDQLREIAAETATGEAITDAMAILRTGKDVGGEVLKGHEAARKTLLDALGKIDQEVMQQEAPEGSLRFEADEMLMDYAERKQSRLTGASRGILFGIPNLDNVVGGIQPGELVLLVGYSNDGKTSLAVQLAWSAAVEQGKNVAFLTTETLRPQVRRKLIARHSKQEMFGLAEGLNSKALKAGSLTADEEQALPAVVSDLAENPAYGQIYVAQVPRAATVNYMEQRLYRIQQKMHIDLVVMDYLALLVSERGRQTQREELASIIKAAKQVATTFDGGRGVPFVSPWQVSRNARVEASKVGMYTSASTAETSEATNSADLLVSLLAPEDNTSRYAEVTGQVLKARDGETANGLVISVDYATSHFSGRTGLQFAPSPAAPTTATLGLGGGISDLLN